MTTPARIDSDSQQYNSLIERLDRLERTQYQAPIGPGGTAGGDLVGTFPNPTVWRAAGDFSVGDDLTALGDITANSSGGARVDLRSGGGGRAEVSFGSPGSTSLYGKSTGVIGAQGYLDADSGFLINGVPLASTMLSDSATLVRTSMTVPFDVSGVTGTTSAIGTGIGDKLALYSGQYGFGIQSNRMVAYVGSSSAAFAIRVTSGTGNKSSGTDAITFFGDGSAIYTGVVVGNQAVSPGPSGFTINTVSSANKPYLQAVGGGSIVSGLFAGMYIESDGSYKASATATGIGTRGIEFLNGALANGGGIRFYADSQNTTANATQVPTERFKIAGDGNIFAPYGPLTVGSTATTTTSFIMHRLASGTTARYHRFIALNNSPTYMDLAGGILSGERSGTSDGANPVFMMLIPAVPSWTVGRYNVAASTAFTSANEVTWIKASSAGVEFTSATASTNPVFLGTDARLWRSSQNSIVGIESDFAIRVGRVGSPSQHIQMTPGDASANYLDSRTAESNQKAMVFRNLHDSGGSAAGTQSFQWHLGAASSPTVVGNLSSAGVLNVTGSAPGYSIAGTPLASTHLSNYANIAHLNESETVAAGWTYTAGIVFRGVGFTVRETGNATNPAMSVSAGTVANPAYLQWTTTTGARKAYIGWGTDTTLDITAENAARINFSQLALATTTAENSMASFTGAGHTFLNNVATQRMVYFVAPTYTGVSTLLGTPGAPTLAVNATGGTLPAGTYDYRITATNASGETLPGPGATVDAVTTGATSTVDVTWGAVAGATGYKVYGRTPGGELLMATLGNVLTWEDDGSVTPAGALPGANTTNPNEVITNAATLAIQNAPVAGTGMTITNPWSFWVQAGNSRFDGSILFSTDVNLYRAGADYLATDDQLGVPYTQTYPTIRTGLRVGVGGAWTLQAQAGLDANGDVGLFHNAYRIYNDAINTLHWNAAHASFGSRAITMSFSGGIRFFADNVATTADATFTPTLRFGISNAGVVSIPASGVLDLSASGTTVTTTGGATGDKISLYNSGGFSYGIGIQAATLVAYVASNGKFAVRAQSGAGNLSSGTDVFAVTAAGLLTGVGAGKTALALTSTGTDTGITFGGDTNLYRSAAHILRSDDFLQVDQTPVTISLGDANTYAFSVRQSAAGLLSFGGTSADAYIQSWGGRELRINSQGEKTFIGSTPGTGLSVAGDFAVTSGSVTLPSGSLNGDAIQDGTLGISSFGFIFGGNNLLYNSGFEASAVVDADPNASFQPWDGWFVGNGSFALVTKPTVEVRTGFTFPVTTIAVKSTEYIPSSGTARIGATTFTYTGVGVDANLLPTLTGVSGGTGAISANAPITVEPQGTDANRVWNYGSNAVKVTATASSVEVYVCPQQSHYIPVTVGKTYTVSAYIGAGLASKNAYLRIIWYTADRVTGAGTQTTGTTTAISSTGMTRLSTSGVAPAGAVYARMDAVIPTASVTAGNLFYFDAFAFSEGDMLFAYEPRSDEILPGSINATMIQAGAVYADAIVANFTITGKRIQTATSPNARVVMEGDNSVMGQRGLGIFNSSNVLRVLLGETDGLQLFDTGGNLQLKLSSTGGLLVGSPTGLRTIFDSTGIQTYDGTPTLRVSINGTDGLALRDSSSNIQVKLSGTGGLQTVGAGGAVLLDSSGISAFNNATPANWVLANQTFHLDRATGTLVLGTGITGTSSRRVVVDRTSMRFYSDSALQFSVIDGVLTTGALTGARVELRSTGLKAYNSGGTNTVAINSDGSAFFTGQIDLVNSTFLGGLGGANRLFNSSFTSPGTGTPRYWFASGSTITTIATPAYWGANAAQVTATATTQSYIWGGTAPVQNSVPVIAGNRYTLSWWIQQVGVTHSGYVAIRWFNASNVQIGGDSTSLAQATTVGSWARHSFSATAPPLAVKASPLFYTLPNTIGDIYYAGAVSFTEADQPVEYAPMPDEILPGTFYETNTNASLSKVTLDSNGIRGYDGTGLMMQLNNSGQLILGPTSGAQRIQIDRSEMRFYQSDGSTIGLTAKNGLISTSNTLTGARVELDGTGTNDWFAVYDASFMRVKLSTSGGTAAAPTGGLELYDTGGVRRLNLSTTGGLQVIGGSSIGRYDGSGITFFTGTTTQDATTQAFKIDAATATADVIIGNPSGQRVKINRTALEMYNSSGTLQMFLDTEGLRSSSATSYTVVGASGFKLYTSSTLRAQLDSTNGLRFWDSGGVLGLQSSAGGLVTGTGTNRAEFLGSGLTLYASSVQTIKLDSATGKLIAGATGSGRRLEVNDSRILGYTSTGDNWLDIDGTVADPSIYLKKNNDEYAFLGVKDFQLGRITDGYSFVTASMTNRYFRIGNVAAEHITFTPSDMQIFDSDANLGLRTREGGLATGDFGGGSSFVQMDKQGFRAVDATDDVVFEVFADGSTPSYFNGILRVNGGVTQVTTTDGIIQDANKHSWVNPAGTEIAYIGARLESGSDAYTTAILATSGLRNFWHLDEAASPLLDSGPGTGVADISLTVSGTPTYSQTELVANETARSSILFNATAKAASSTSFASDMFVGTPGTALNGRTALFGGTWATTGATTDFTIQTSPIGIFADQSIVRSNFADASARIGILGTQTFTDTHVQATTLRFGGPGAGTFTTGQYGAGKRMETGVIARYVDSSNYVRLTAYADTGHSYMSVRVVKVKAGVETVLALHSTFIPLYSNYIGLILLVNEAGVITYKHSTDGATSTLDTDDTSTGPPWYTATLAADADLATGGVLASGKVGVYDYADITNLGLPPIDRWIDYFKANVPSRNFEAKQFTVECWVNQGTVNATDQVIWEISNGLATVEGRGLRLCSSTSGLRLFAYNRNSNWELVQSSVDVVTPGTLTASTTYHIAVVMDYGAPNNQFKIYRNGVLLKQYDPGMAILPAFSLTRWYNGVVYKGDGSSIMTIGNLQANTTGFVGRIDEVAYYTTNLSASTIASHYNVGNSTGIAETELRVKIKSPDAGSVLQEKILLDELGKSDFIPGQQYATAMDFTTPAGNYTPPVGSFGLCGWYTELIVGPSQQWHVYSSSLVTGTTGAWIRTSARVTVKDNVGGAAPAGVTIGSPVWVTYTHNAGTVSHNMNPWGLITTTSAVAQGTVVRVHLEFNNGAAGPIINRDGTYFGFMARRVY